MSLLEDLEKLYNPKDSSLHLDHTHLKLIENVQAVFVFIEKYKVKTFSIQDLRNINTYTMISGLSHKLFDTILKYIAVNKTLTEVNLSVFGPIIKKGTTDLLIKDLFFVNNTLQRVFLSRYDHIGAYSYVIHR
jgi:hypothetical protein